MTVPGGALKSIVMTEDGTSEPIELSGVALGGYTAVGVQTGGGTVVVEGMIAENDDWTALLLTNLADGSTTASIADTSLYQGQLLGVTWVRLVVSGVVGEAKLVAVA